MDLAMIGLGRMGGNMARRLMRGGHRVVGFAHSPDAIHQFAAEGGLGAYSLAEAVEQLPDPKIVWIMVPAGDPTDETVNRLLELLHPATPLSTVATPTFVNRCAVLKPVAPKDCTLSTWVPAAASGD